MPAGAFIAAVCRRDFDAIGRLLTPDVRMRALLPSRYVEAIGDEVVASFTRWIGTPGRFEVIAVGSDDVLGRARVQWRFRVAPNPTTGAPGWHEIEQVGFCETSAGLISRIDLQTTPRRCVRRFACNRTVGLDRALHIGTPTHFHAARRVVQVERQKMGNRTDAHRSVRA